MKPCEKLIARKMLRLCILRRYDVKAGSDVEILILNTALGTARGVPTVVVGTFAEEAFEQLYGPLAKSQAEGMEPIVTAFLEGTL